LNRIYLKLYSILNYIFDIYYQDIYEMVKTENTEYASAVSMNKSNIR